MALEPSPLPWLPPDPVQFPDPASAWADPNGLLAAGGDLTPEWLVTAYSHGVFPWFDDDDGPVLWWSPDPRATLTPADLRVTRSLRKRLRNGPFRVSADQAFAQVLAGCAGPRADASGTWITERMQRAYTRLHELGIAHSIEVWEEQRLVGGLYGVAVGRLFCGESMFSHQRDASKIAFATLATQLRRWDFALIDCQLPTEHLQSLGASEQPRHEFLNLLQQLREQAPIVQALWQLDADILQAAAAP